MAPMVNARTGGRDGRVREPAGGRGWGVRGARAQRVQARQADPEHQPAM